MSMHNPTHPGKFIREVYILPFNLSARKVASSLGVSPSTFNRLLNGESNVSPEMALRLSKSLGRSPESWLTMQDNYNLWHARKKLNL
ncbi:MAG: HigA family addiction module antidote protein, partial [Desulfobacteraceae bacterium]|nr:HigA family addiction module antidote protein [Desulfobacteraceae bacterium]